MDSENRERPWDSTLRHSINHEIAPAREIDKLRDVDTMDEAQLFSILSSYAKFEELEYGQIVKTRLSVIDQLGWIRMSLKTRLGIS